MALLVAPSTAVTHYLDSPYNTVFVSIFPRQYDFCATALRLPERLMRYRYFHALLLLLLTHLLQPSSSASSYQPTSHQSPHPSDSVIVSIQATATRRSASRLVWNPGISSSEQTRQVLDSRASVASTESWSESSTTIAAETDLLIFVTHAQHTSSLYKLTRKADIAVVHRGLADSRVYWFYFGSASCAWNYSRQFYLSIRPSCALSYGRRVGPHIKQRLQQHVEVVKSLNPSHQPTPHINSNWCCRRVISVEFKSVKHTESKWYRVLESLNLPAEVSRKPTVESGTATVCCLHCQATEPLNILSLTLARLDDICCRCCVIESFNPSLIPSLVPVSYTHLTLPTNREV